jgi:hypothetical protein
MRLKEGEGVDSMGCLSAFNSVEQSVEKCGQRRGCGILQLACIAYL